MNIRWQGPPVILKNNNQQDFAYTAAMIYLHSLPGQNPVSQDVTRPQSTIHNAELIVN